MQALGAMAASLSLSARRKKTRLVFYCTTYTEYQLKVLAMSYRLCAGIAQRRRAATPVPPNFLDPNLVG